MLFTSSTFLYLFLPTVLGLYLILGKFCKHVWPALYLLIVASFIFYGYQNTWNVALLLLSISANYAIYHLIRNEERSGAWLFLGVLINLGFLGYFKYSNFFLEVVGDLTGRSFDALDIALPLAISFYTFQQIAFLADAHSGKVNGVSCRDYFLFVTFFPQLIIGPIVHHKEMMPQFRRPGVGSAQWPDFITGACYLFSGLIKKLFIADPLGGYVDEVHTLNESGAQIGFAQSWLSALCFSMQIYFDFSGYTDMAIGLARLFGIRLPINFFSPYKSRNIVEFWRRWHITLSRWLRDYLYVPLGGGRVGQSRLVINAMIVFILGGLWHGAAWTFVFWGLLHGAAVAVVHTMSLAKASLPRIFGVVTTFLFVTLSWVLFRAESLNGAWRLYESMFVFPDAFVPAGSQQVYIVLTLALMLVFFLPNTHQLIPKVGARLRRLPKPAVLWFGVMIWLLFMAFDLDSSAEFIYFDF